MPRKLSYKGSFGGTSRVGDIVSHNGTDYTCRRSGSSPPPDPEFWTPSVIHDPAFGVEGPQGPPGRDGINGKDGRDGQSIPGRDGSGFTFRGTWKRQQYQVNDVVTHEGSTFVATSPTRSEPTETSRNWTLMAAKGERGEDGLSIQGPRGRTAQILVDGNTAKAFFDSAAVRGNAVYASSDGHVDLASAAPAVDGIYIATAIGLATAATPEGGYGGYVTSGPFVCDGWNWEPGRMVYLSTDVPGGLTQVYPNGAGQFVVLIGQAVAPNALILNIHYLVERAD